MSRFTCVGRDGNGGIADLASRASSVADASLVAAGDEYVALNGTRFFCSSVFVLFGGRGGSFDGSNGGALTLLVWLSATEEVEVDSPEAYDRSDSADDVDSTELRLTILCSDGRRGGKGGCDACLCDGLAGSAGL